MYETRAVRQFLMDTAGYRRDRIGSLPYWRRGSDGTTLDEARATTVMTAIDSGIDPETLDPFELEDAQSAND
ncbi:hypothetical protein [Ilumatobacter nonamiensis]|uniref:hypothetical protein n=1 Tax=Ilumatobacter nonamiensis TaxID=467093 RepID=UPI00034D411B|nr:hypothetical protein [Ilumatobacter nonamiensis]